MCVGGWWGCGEGEVVKKWVQPHDLFNVQACRYYIYKLARLAKPESVMSYIYFRLISKFSSSTIFKHAYMFAS